MFNIQNKRSLSYTYIPTFSILV